MKIRPDDDAKNGDKTLVGYLSWAIYRYSVTSKNYYGFVLRGYQAGFWDSVSERVNNETWTDVE